MSKISSKGESIREWISLISSSHVSLYTEKETNFKVEIQRRTSNTGVKTVIPLQFLRLFFTSVRTCAMTYTRTLEFQEIAL